jgi:hypothetical protein
VGGAASGSGGGFIAAWRILTEIWVGPARASGSSAPRTTAFGSAISRGAPWRGAVGASASMDGDWPYHYSSAVAVHRLAGFHVYGAVLASLIFLSSFLLANKFACNHYSFFFFLKMLQSLFLETTTTTIIIATEQKIYTKRVFCN